MSFIFLTLFVALTMASTAMAEVNFNECRAIRDSTYRLKCLEQASERFQTEMNNYESFDLLTAKTFRLTTKSMAIEAGLDIADGMYFQEPNDVNSGQYMGTLLKPSIGLLWRNGSSVSLSIDYAKMAGNGAGDNGSKRNGRPHLSGTYNLSQQTNQRWFLLSEIDIPLASGDLYKSFAIESKNVWGVAIGTAYENAIQKWLFYYGINIHYDFEETDEYSSSQSLIGTYYQHPVIARLVWNTKYQWLNDSLGPGVYFDYGLTKGRTIITGDPSRPNGTDTTYDPTIQVGGLELNYQHDFGDHFLMRLRLWKSAINSFPDNLRLNLDDPSEAASIGLNVNATVYF